MARMLKCTTAFILIFMFFIELPPTTYAETNSVTVNTPSLNMRSGPSLTSDVTGSLKKGEQVEVLSTSGDWLQVKSGNQTGWIASWLTVGSNETQSASTIVSRVDRLNVRSGPSTGAAVLARMDAGDEALMTGREGNWAQVTMNGTSGWIHTDYISEMTNEQSIVPNETVAKAALDQFTVAVDTLNVRNEADLSSKRVDVIHKNETYTVKNIDGNWVHISLENGNEGWVYSFHGALSSTAPTIQTGVSNAKTVTILTDGTNIREKATTSSQIVLRANAGEQFEITKESGDWYELSLPSGESAFIAKWVVSSDKTPDEQVAKVTKKKARVPGTLKGLTIVIDPGHGGNDRGTTGARGTDEKDITLLTSELLAAKLKAAGATVVLTRESDYFVSLRKRVAVSHQYPADAFISVHYDAH